MLAGEGCEASPGTVKAGTTHQMLPGQVHDSVFGSEVRYDETAQCVRMLVTSKTAMMPGWGPASTDIAELHEDWGRRRRKKKRRNNDMRR